MAHTCVLIAPVQQVWHRVSCSNEILTNAPKHYERHQIMSLGSNGVYQVRLFGKITTWLHGTNFCINCTSSVCFAPSFMHLRKDPNAPKYYKTYKNITLGSNGWIGCVRCEKSRCDFVEQSFALIALINPVLHRVSCSYEMIPNATKHYEMHQNMSLGSNGVD